jgi:hypothetical protein
MAVLNIKGRTVTFTADDISPECLRVSIEARVDTLKRFLRGTEGMPADAVATIKSEAEAAARIAQANALLHGIIIHREPALANLSVSELVGSIGMEAYKEALSVIKTRRKGEVAEAESPFESPTATP